MFVHEDESIHSLVSLCRTWFSMDGFRLHAAIMSSGVAMEGMSLQVIPAQIGMPDVRGKTGEGAKGDAVGRAASEPIAHKCAQRNGRRRRKQE